MITEAGLRSFFAARLRGIAARDRVPSPRPRFAHYQHHRIWHVCPYDQRLPFDDSCWIEVAW